MKPDRVIYHKLFPLGAYVNEKIGVEIQLDEGDSPEDALIHAKALVETFHKMSNPGLALDETTINSGQVPIAPAEEKTEEQDKVSAITQIISLCDTSSKLARFKKEVDRINHPSLTEAYEKRLEELKSK